MVYTVVCVFFFSSPSQRSLLYDTGFEWSKVKVTHPADSRDATLNVHILPGNILLTTWKVRLKHDDDDDDDGDDDGDDDDTDDIDIIDDDGDDIDGDKNDNGDDDDTDNIDIIDDDDDDDEDDDDK